MTANELRQSFLAFFRDRGHAVVPSASLMPTSPNLLFTNAGMNQFVPYFLGTEAAPYDPPRAVDTQKCIRAGGKHNDLDDVGYDTYHHTLFEMLGNWSFGDYFKAEAIRWAWDLVVGTWGFPANRLYTTVYAPGEGDPSEFDEEAHGLWAKLFRDAGLDPAVHIVPGNVKDNFWAMGDTGPCGPCSELHVDLTPRGDTRGSLVNAGDPRCIEIWNLVFIQFNRDEDGGYRPLPARHVDTGMGFERACSILQCTRGFQDFSRLASNYDTDVFAPLFSRLGELSQRRYSGTVPASRSGLSEAERTDVAFRVIGDHLRALAFSIADGILPGNKGRNYVLRGILRRAVRFGRQLGLGEAEPFLPRLVPVLADSFGEAFPELRLHRQTIEETLEAEESLFNRTLDRGLKFFDDAADKAGARGFPPEMVVKLWETYGFPLDLTEQMLAERGLATDRERVAELIEEHKHTGSEGQTSQVVSAVRIETRVRSEFVGYEHDDVEARILEWVEEGGEVVAIVDRSPLYVEKGGQAGDTGTLSIGRERIPVTAATGAGEALCLHLARKPKDQGALPVKVGIRVDGPRRRDVERHHTATHLLHWALHERVDRDAVQQGSSVGPDRLRFDFNSKALTPEQLAAVEALVNERIRAADPVSWTEVPHREVKGRRDVMQFFGDKYGEQVRVVQIGGHPGQLDGYSMELCGGTHVRNTADIGLCVIRSEGAVAAGIRRIEALCGQAARDHLAETFATLRREVSELADTARGLAEEAGEAFPAPTVPSEDPAWAAVDASGLDTVLAALAEWRSVRDALRDRVLELRKKAQKRLSKQRAAQAEAVLGDLVAGAGAGPVPVIVHHFGEGDGELLQEALSGLKRRHFAGMAVLAATESGDGKVHLAITVDPAHVGLAKAGDLMRDLIPIVGGRGGGKPELARGAGTDPARVDALLAEARRRLEAVCR
jgi:alanyl-tRNA synthetase